MNPLCRAEGVALIPWSPLARGFLAGNRLRGRRDATLREQHDEYGHSLYYSDADYDIADAVVDVARRKQARPIQVALAWILGQPGVTSPIVSVTKKQQLDQLIDGLALRLTPEDAKELEAPYQPRPILGHE
jgi:aryl-alcohol dehydrogenase (NADP+)